MMEEVSGLDTIIANLNREISKIEGKVQKGLTLAGLFVKGRSMEKTPVDVGNLRGSHYVVSGDGAIDAGGPFKPDRKGGTRVADEHLPHVQDASSRIRSKNKPFIEIGLSAYYAEAVHEDLEARHPTGGTKFLERAFRENQKQMLEIVKRFAKR